MLGFFPLIIEPRHIFYPEGSNSIVVCFGDPYGYPIVEVKKAFYYPCLLIPRYRHDLKFQKIREILYAFQFDILIFFYQLKIAELFKYFSRGYPLIVSAAAAFQDGKLTLM